MKRNVYYHDHMHCCRLGLCLALIMVGMMAKAQLSTNPDKFLGNITTSGQVDFGNEKFYQLWNQITGENESRKLQLRR